MTSTKGKAWREVKDGVGAAAQRRRILHYIQGIELYGYKPSRAEIARDTKTRLSSVCARVDELVKAGLVEVTGTKQDPHTKKTVETLGPAKIWKRGPDHPDTGPAPAIPGQNVLDRWTRSGQK